MHLLAQITVSEPVVTTILITGGSVAASSIGFVIKKIFDVDRKVDVLTQEFRDHVKKDDERRK